MLKMYGYNKCGTCQKAKKYLQNQNILFDDIDITQTPPSKKILNQALKSGYSIKDLFNKSGVQYRELNMKDKLPKMSQKEAIDLLSQNGRLVKRPIVTDGDKITIGFKEDVFQKNW